MDKDDKKMMQSSCSASATKEHDTETKVREEGGLSMIDTRSYMA